MAAMSDYLETQLLNLTLRATPYTAPPTVYAGLFGGDPTDTGTGATEVAIARQPVAFDAPTAEGKCANSGDINWTGMPAGGVTHIGLFDDATGGNMLYHGPLAAAKNVNEGDTLTVYAGDLEVTLA